MIGRTNTQSNLPVIRISCTDENGTQMTGIIITVTDVTTGTVYKTHSYNGSPIAIVGEGGQTYKIQSSTKTGYANPGYVKITLTGIVDVRFKFYETIIYGFHIDSSNSDPSGCVTYLEDAVGLTPAAMNFNTGVFDYGSWENAFFMPRPCMLKYDGTVDYYLDPDDYTKKEDGVTASDVANTSYGGNAMMEWGRDGNKIWYKIVPDSDPTSASIYISNTQVDSNYRAWSFYDINNQPINHFYTSIYDGATCDSKLRSISGLGYKTTGTAYTSSAHIAHAEANNVSSTNKIWYVEQWADTFLINTLLILICKTLNMQAAIGTGVMGKGSSWEQILTTGTMNTRGLFWGYSTSAATTNGVKVFGMENWWGNHCRIIGGMLISNFTQLYKMTRGTIDGSSATDYNLTGTGYLSGCTCPSIGDAFISKCTFNNNEAWISSTDGVDGTYYCDTYELTSTDTMIPYRGGFMDYWSQNGPFFFKFLSTSGYHFKYNATLSCKPLAS